MPAPTLYPQSSTRLHRPAPLCLAALLTACYPATVAPDALPPGGLVDVRSVAWGSVSQYEERAARHAQRPHALPGVDWFSNGCGDHLTLGYAAAFTAACNQHDFGYRNLRSHASTHTGAARKVTDDVLYAHMREVCSVKAGRQRRVCGWTAAALYGFVRVFGGFYFGGVW